MEILPLGVNFHISCAHNDFNKLRLYNTLWVISATIKILDNNWRCGNDIGRDRDLVLSEYNIFLNLSQPWSYQSSICRMRVSREGSQTLSP